MPPAARLGDTSTHGGAIVGPCEATVLIGGMPAAVLGDNHACPLMFAPGAPHAVTPFPAGSGTVLIGGKPAVRVGDVCICGGGTAVGEPTVLIG
jgi:uncharacterized Zn-binding protein involved in type VI secretion